LLLEKWLPGFSYPIYFCEDDSPAIISLAQEDTMAPLLRFTFLSSAAFCIAVAVLLSTHLSAEPSADATGIIDSIALAAGMSDLSSIREIGFTYYAKSFSGKAWRRWQWFPQTDEVIFTGKNPKGKKETVTYSRKSLADSSKNSPVHTVDAWFVNDIYWLLFPYFLKNDPLKRAVRKNSVVMPLSGKWATGIRVEYYKPDPRRPGATFELYVDTTYRIKEWTVYLYESRRAVTVNKWGSYRKAGPFLVSFSRTTRKGKGITVKISNVKISKADE
jgi:hypothetical protein